MSHARPRYLMSLALALAACSIGKPIPQATTYGIDVAPPERHSSGASRRESLRIGSVRVSAPYAGNGLVYRVDDVRLVSDPYSQFITEPGALLADQMAAWFDRAGSFKTVAHPESTRPADYLLEAIVSELYGDFRPRRAPSAVLTMHFSLIDETSVRPRSVLERTISRRVNLPRASPDALVRGYGQALTEILAELTADLQAAPPK